MFRNRDNRTVTRDDRRVARDAEEAYATEEAPDRRSEYKRQLMRAVMTLLGAAVAGVLIWLATQVGDDSTAGYWGKYALVGAAGLTLALSQLLGGWTKWGLPKLSAAVFLIGFLPVLVVGGWMLVAHQPEGASFRGDVVGWSNDMGVKWLVDDFREYLPVIAFAIGLVFGFSFDTKGPRVRRARAVAPDRDVRAVPAEERAAADEPMAAERRTVATPSEPHLGDGTTTDDDRVRTTDDDRVATTDDDRVRTTEDDRVVTRQGTTTRRSDD